MMKKLLATFAVLALPMSAQAVTFVGSTAGAPDPGAAAGQSVVFDFESATPALTGNFQLATGSVSGVYAAPALDASQYAVVPMAGMPTGTATLDLSGLGPLGTLSFYWGSIDSYNFVKFFSGATEIFSMDGTMMPPASGDQFAAGTNRRAFFSFAPTDNVTSMQFISNGVAFEFDDVAISAAVPEASTWAMLIAGFGIVGAAMRRRSVRAVVRTA